MKDSVFAKKLVWIGIPPLFNLPLLQHNCCQPLVRMSGALVWKDDECSEENQRS